MKRSSTSRKVKNANWCSTSYHAVSSDDDAELERLSKKPTYHHHTIVGVPTTGATATARVTAFATADTSAPSPQPTFQFDDGLCSDLHNPNDGQPDILENFDFMDPHFFAAWNEDHGLGADGLPVEKRVRTLEVIHLLVGRTERR